MPAGYSGTPLGKKLGYCDAGPVWAVGMPDAVRAEIVTYAPVVWTDSAAGAHAAHIFETGRDRLTDHLRRARNQMADTGMVWVSWPKRASKVETDITEDVIRDIALPMGFVDVKVCAVDAVWSGLKLVVRTSLRA